MGCKNQQLVQQHDWQFCTTSALQKPVNITEVDSCNQSLYLIWGHK